MMHDDAGVWEHLYHILPKPPEPSGFWCFKFASFKSRGGFHSVQYPSGITLRLITKGRGEIVVAGRTYSLSRGSLFCAIPGTLISISDKPKAPWHWCEFQLMGEQALEYVHALGISAMNPHMRVDLQSARRILRQLQTGFKKNQPYQQIALLYEFLQTCGTRQSLQDLSPRDTRRQIVATAKAIIHAQMTSRLNITQLCKQTKINRSTLLRYFKEVEGITPIEYLQACRLEQARAMLRQTDLTIKEIAFAAGFNTDKYFINCFTKYYNTSPAAWRRACNS